VWYNISVRGKDNKLYFKATTPHIEREKRYLKRGEVTLQGFPLTTEVIRSLSADSQSHKR
jgi:hypothetical protein